MVLARPKHAQGTRRELAFALEVQGRPMKIRVLREDPVVRVIEGFATPQEADEVVSTYSHLLRRSTVIKDVAKGLNQLDNARTSSTAYLPAGKDDDVIHRIEKRAVALTGTPLKFLETLQLTKYEEGQLYKPHHDDFQDDALPYQRTWTIFCYLNDADLAACTEFPDLDLKVEPRQGHAAMWENCRAHGRTQKTEPLFKHGGMPPRTGEKYGLNIWFRTLPYR
jgi:prolyl 4-hydroxylase